MSGHRPWSEVRDARLARTQPGGHDELDEYLEEQIRDPEFARWWHWAECRAPRKLCIDGREYHRRHQARKRRSR